MKDYRNSMPLQPFPHGLLHPFLGQKEAMCQTLGNTTPFTFFPHPYAGAREEWLAVQLELGLPRLRSLGGGSYARPDLRLWLLYGNALRWLKGNLSHNVTMTGRSLFGDMWPLSDLYSLRRRWGERRLTLALRWLLLPGLPGIGHEVVDRHGLPGHHVSTKIELGVRKVGDINSCLFG